MQPPTCYNLSMTIFTPYLIILFALLILLLLQLSPGIFALFLHYASGKYSRPKTSRLSLFYVLGAETMTTCVFLSLYFLANLLFLTNYPVTSQIALYVLAGILIALSLFALVFYYRRGKHSVLFITRKYASSLEATANSVKTPSDAFVLGALSGNAELFLVAPLFLVIIFESFRQDCIYPTAFITIIFSILPLIITHWRFASGQNLANVLKSRAKNKPFIRFSLFIFYLLIAIIIFVSGATK